MKAAVGRLACFICGDACDVYTENSKRKYLYYRCQCGVIQPRTPFGQGKMRERLQLFEPGTPAANDAENATARNAIAEQREAVREVKKELPVKSAPGMQTIIDAWAKK